MTVDNSRLLKIKRYTKDQRVFIVEQYFKNNESFSNKIIFNYKAHFHLDGLINRQNYRIWDSENPLLTNKQMHLQRVIVWCRFCVGDIIGSIFFENAVGHAITVNSARYCDMIIQFFCA